VNHPEARHDPWHEPEGVHDRADVEEGRARAFDKSRAQIVDRRDKAFWENHRAKVEQAARAADPARA
jgi:hypothetical protein